MKRVCQNLEENWELRMLVLVYLSVNWDHVVTQGCRAGNCPPAGLQTVGCSQLQLVDYFTAWSWRASASWPVMVTLGLVRGLQVSEVGLYLSKLLARKKSPRYGCTIATWTEGPVELQSGRLHALRPVLIFYPERTAGSEWVYIVSLSELVHLGARRPPMQVTARLTATLFSTGVLFSCCFKDWQDFRKFRQERLVIGRNFMPWVQFAHHVLTDAEDLPDYP